MLGLIALSCVALLGVSSSLNEPVFAQDPPGPPGVASLDSAKSQDLSAPGGVGVAGPSVASPGNRWAEPPPAGASQASPVSNVPEPDLEPASFKGVTPGVTTVTELHSQWGAPKEVASRGEEMVYLFSVAPFEHVEVIARKDKVEAIVIRLNRAFPTEKVAEHLALSTITPVLVANEKGEILALGYPERGVILALLPAQAPGRANFQTAEIILQPLSAELFLLRAETYLWRDPEASLRDLTIAVRLMPTAARAHWLRARILAARGEYPAAEAACLQAVQLSPSEAAYLLTLSEILQRQGRLEEARRALYRAEAMAESRPHLKARVACVGAELATRESPPDYARALELYQEAIRRAEPFAGSEYPAIRQVAKETLLDAYLGAADCIAFGKWRQKEVALPHWWERAERVAADLVENEGRPEDFRFYVLARAIGACAILKGAVDPVPYADKLVELSARMIPDSAPAGVMPSPAEANRRRQLAQALYEATVVTQNQGKGQKALTYAEKAAAILRPVAENPVSAEPADRFLLGKILFRIGASYAVAEGNHHKAVEWFDKALPVFDTRIEPGLSPTDRGTLGEMLVSMGVSYWEVGKKDLGYQLTERGTRLVEEAVAGGHYPRSALAAPYTNLATMERHRGNPEVAERYLQQARQIKGTLQR